ncbi:helix-turn-helix domain-containing protein [Proteus terrae]|uniref:helix-turn-helix domain-containing protein n=1 Tax=Proteus terrae TaxID=1574161 RepID=UPI003C2FF810
MNINSLLLKSKQLTSQMTGVYELSMSGFSHADLTEMVGVALNLCSSLHNDIQNNIDELKNTGKPTVNNYYQQACIEFAERLKVALYQSGVTQAELAGCIGVSQGVVSNIINAKGKKPTKYALQIAQALGVNYQWLRYGAGEMTDFCTSKTEGL